MSETLYGWYATLKYAFSVVAGTAPAEAEYDTEESDSDASDSDASDTEESDTEESDSEEAGTEDVHAGEEQLRQEAAVAETKRKQEEAEERVRAEAAAEVRRKQVEEDERVRQEAIAEAKRLKEAEEERVRQEAIAEARRLKEAEEERVRQEAIAEARRLKEAEEERVRQEAIAEAKHLKEAEEERVRQEAIAEARRLKEAEEERVRQEAIAEARRLKEAEEERVRQEAIAEAKRLKEAEEERVRLEALAEAKRLKEAEEERVRLEAVEAKRKQEEEEERLRVEAAAAKLKKEAAEKARAELVARCIAMADPNGASATQLKTITDLRTPIKKMSAEPTTEDQADAEKALLALQTTIADTRGAIADRAAAAQAVARAQAAFKQAETALSTDCRTALQGKLTKAATDVTNAATATELQAAVKLAKDFAEVAAKEAIDYGTEHAKLLAKTAIYDAVTAVGDTAAALTAAETLAKTGNFKTALADLDAFRTVNADAEGHTKVYAALDAYRKVAEASRLNILLRTPADYPGIDGIATSLSSAKTAAFDTIPRAPDPAVVTIAALATTVQGYAAYARELAAVAALQATPAFARLPALVTADVSAKAAAAKILCATDPQGGATALAAILTQVDLADVVVYARAEAAMAPLVTAVGTNTTLAGTQHVIDAMAAAKLLYDGNKLGEATTALDKLRPDAAAILELRAASADFATAATGLDPTALAALRKPADEALAAGKFTDAAAAFKLAATGAQPWQLYQERRAEVDAMEKSADPGQKAALAPYLARADTAVAAGLPADARAALDELRQVDEVSTLDAAAAAAVQRLARLRVSVAAADNLLATAPPKQALATALKAADDKLNVDHDLAATAALMDTAEAAAKGAVAYVRSLAATNAVSKALGAPSTADAAALSAAIALAGTGDFVQATTDLDLLRASWAAQASARATALETADGGHSLAAHGAATAGLQVNRLETGTRPDNVNMPASMATNFDNDTDWLAARQMAAERLLTEYGVDVSGTAAATTGQTQFQIIIEHGRPIDRCVVGLREKLTAKQSGPNKSEVGGTMKYETHEVWSGLTRTRSNFKYESGRWKLHQQFPHPDGWDDVNKRYTEPLPAIR